MRQEGEQWLAYAQRVSPSGTREFCLVPDVEVHWVDDREHGSGFFFQPHAQVTTAPRLPQPAELI